MNEIELRILRLAENCRKPGEFIHNLEALSERLPNEKCDFFLRSGAVLHKYSYFTLALNTWDYALKNFVKDDDNMSESKCLASLGLAYYSLGDPRKAIGHYEKALEIKKQIGDKNGESACYGNLGLAFDSLGDFREAISYYKKALKIDLETGDRPGQSKCYTNIGIAFAGLGDFKTAIKYHEKSLKMDKENRDIAGESSCYVNLGLAFDNLGDFRRAIEQYEKALKIDLGIGDRAGEAKCYVNLGNAYRSLGDFRKAIDYNRMALRIAKKIGDKVGKAKCYVNLGIAFECLGDYPKAIEYQQKALKIDLEIGDRAGQSKCYGNLGIAYYNLGDLRKAIEYYKKALTIYLQIGNRAGESSCYVNLGLAYYSLGDFRKAIDYNRMALKIAKKIGDNASESKCYTHIGLVHYSLGDFMKAIEYHEKTLCMVRKNGDKPGESSCYVNLGVVYSSLGDHKKAIEYCKKSLGIKKEIGDRAGQSKCYVNLGNAYYSLGDPRKAIGHYQKALRVVKEIGDKVGESASYGNLGVAYRSLADFRKAIEFHEKALEIAKKIGDRAGESKCYANLGTAYRDMGDFKKAIEFYEKALEIDKEIGDIDSQRIINLNLGRIYYESRPQLAHGYCKHSIELSEMIGGKLVEEEHKIGFYARASDAYQYMVSLCLKLEKDNEAFEYAERSKSRAFIDLLAATEIRPTVGLTKELRSLLDSEEKHLARLREIQTRNLKKAKISVGLGETEHISKNLSQIYDEIEDFDPEYVYTRRGKPLSVDKMQRMLHSPKKSVVLIEYFIARDATFIFIISSKDDKLHVKTASISSEKLGLYLDNFWREVVDYSSFRHIGDTWLGLSDYLIEPISEYLTDGELIYFVPYGLLHYLPLHALDLEGEPLIKKHPVAYSPSASQISLCQKKGSGKLRSCAAFGVASEKDEKDVTLLFEKEAEEVADLFNANSCNRHLAIKNRVRKECIDKDVIHFSCHGRFVDVDPLSSGVELYDGVLTAREIFGTRLNTELVTLSACETGLNERSPGDELIGLTRAFIYAGAPSVVVSLWSVNALSTKELMLEFYRLLKKGVDKATALQKAQKKIMKKEEYSHPYYWAPFILVGDWE